MRRGHRNDGWIVWSRKPWTEKKQFYCPIDDKTQFLSGTEVVHEASTYGSRSKNWILITQKKKRIKIYGSFDYAK